MTLAKSGKRAYNAHQLAAENTLMAEDAADLGGLKRPPFNICAPGRAHSLEGASPLRTRQGESLAKGKGVRREAESGGSL